MRTEFRRASTVLAVLLASFLAVAALAEGTGGCAPLAELVGFEDASQRVR